jgi:hypothetical protein
LFVLRDEDAEAAGFGSSGIVPGGVGLLRGLPQVPRPGDLYLLSSDGLHGVLAPV